MSSPRPRRALVAGAIALLAAAVLLPGVLPKPDLREGRKLAPPPQLAGDLAELRRQTDAYVADHFPARRHLITTLNFIRLKLGVSGSDKVLIGREGWLYYNDGSLLGHARGVERQDEAHARRLLTSLQARVEFLDARDAAYLVVAPPVQEAIYPEFGPPWFRLDPTRNSRAVADLAQQALPGRLLHLEPALVAAKAAGVTTFSRHDTHWTGDGAYAGYVAIMQALRAQGLQQPTRPLSDFTPNVTDPKRPRDLARMIGVTSFVPIHYRAYADPASPRWKTTWLGDGRRDFTAPQVVDTGAAGKPVLLMQRDSFSNALLPFLTGHFSRVVLTHIDDGFWRPELVDRFKPDFVILEVQEAGLTAVLGPAPPPAQPSYPAIEAALADARSFKPTRAEDRLDLAEAPKAKGCSVDLAAIERGELHLVGWLSDLRAEPGYRRAAIRLHGPGGDFIQGASIDLPRPDLAAAFRRPVGEPSGFDLRLRSLRVPPGDYDLTIYRATQRGWISCAGPKVAIAGVP